MISEYQQVTDNRVHAPLRAAMQAGDVAFLEYRPGRKLRYKEVAIVRITPTSIFIRGRTDDRRFSIKDGVEWGKKALTYRDRIFACTEPLTAYIDRLEQERSESLWRSHTISAINAAAWRAVSSATLQTVLDLLENDKGRTQELLERSSE